MKARNATAADANASRHPTPSPRRGGLFERFSCWVRAACCTRQARRDGRSRARLLRARLRRPKRVDGPWQPDAGLRALVRAFSDPDPRVRQNALEVVSRFSGEHATNLVTGAIHDVDPEVRCAAVHAATRLGVPGVMPALIVATEDPDPVVREASTDAIDDLAGRLFDAHAAPPRETAALKIWWRQQRLRELLDGGN